MIALARMTGLPPNQNYELTDDVHSPLRPLSRSTTRSSRPSRPFGHQGRPGQVRAAEHALSAARDERIPSLSVNGNYGAIGTNPAQAKETYSAAATSAFHLAGRPHRRRHQAGRGSLASGSPNSTTSRARLKATCATPSSIWRPQPARSRSPAQSSGQPRDARSDPPRFDAASPTMSRSYSQESLTAAELDGINSVFAHNVAKLSSPGSRQRHRQPAAIPQFSIG